MRIGDVKIGEEYWAKKHHYGCGYPVRVLAVEPGAKQRVVRVELIREMEQQPIGARFITQARHIIAPLAIYERDQRRRDAQVLERELREAGAKRVAERIAGRIGVSPRRVRAHYDFVETPEPWQMEDQIRLVGTADGFRLVIEPGAFEMLLRALGLDVSAALDELLVKVDVPD